MLSVPTGVCGLIWKHHQVLRGVIVFITINVMNDLPRL